MAFQRDAFQPDALQPGSEVKQPISAFQRDGFQGQAFQIGHTSGGAAVAAINPLAGLLIFAQAGAMAVRSLIVAR